MNGVFLYRDAIHRVSTRRPTKKRERHASRTSPRLSLFALWLSPCVLRMFLLSSQSEFYSHQGLILHETKRLGNGTRLVRKLLEPNY